MISDRKYQDGDLVVWNMHKTLLAEPSHTHDRNAVVTSVYTSAGRGKDGDYAYNILYSYYTDGITREAKNTVWGYQLRPRMFKYDPKQAGDTDEDI